MVAGSEDGSALPLEASNQRVLLQGGERTQVLRNRQHMAAYMAHPHHQGADGNRRPTFRMHDPAQLGLLDGIERGGAAAREMTPQRDATHGSMDSPTDREVGMGAREVIENPLEETVRVRAANVVKLHGARLARAGFDVFDERTRRTLVEQDTGETEFADEHSGDNAKGEEQTAAQIEQEPIFQGVDPSIALQAAKRRLRPKPRPLPLFPDELLAPVIAAHRQRGTPLSANSSADVDERGEEPGAAAERGLAIAETLDDLGPSHLKVAVLALGVDLFVYRVAVVRAKGEWVLR